MGAQLRGRVRVKHPDTGRVGWVGPGDCPDWAVPLIRSGRAWVDGTPPAVGETPTVASTDTDAEPLGYGSWTVATLKGEISSRNSTRDEADRIPADGNKADLVAALEADDESS